MYILTLEKDGRQFLLNKKEFETFEAMFGECELIEEIEPTACRIVKTPAPWEETRPSN